MQITLKAQHQTFLLADILTWSTNENQIDIFITNIEFVPWNGECVTAKITYKKI